MYFSKGRNIGIRLIPVFLVVAAMFGCRRDKTGIIAEKVAERVQDFRVRERIKCRETLMSEAAHLADSILLAEAMMEVNDSLSRLRPAKPYRPAPVPPIDSLRVAPLFERGGN